MTLKKILLVEDSKSQASVLTKLLNQHGFAVSLATSLHQLQCIINTANNADFFLAICDFVLPDAPNGEAIDLLLENNFTTIVHTTNISQTLRDSMRVLPIADYVLKSGKESLIMLADDCTALWRNRDLTVLLVDDSVSSLELMSYLLRKQQYKVITATGAEMALELLESTQPDIVVLDYILPGVNGVELCKSIRSARTKMDLSIIGISVKADDKTSIGFLKHGANDFIAKPFSPEEFICRINRSAEALCALMEANEKSERSNLMQRMLSHDIRNPVGIMVSATKRLSKMLALDEQQQTLTKMILEGGTTVLNLLDSALEIHKLEQLHETEMKEISFDESLNTVLQEYRERFLEKNIALKVDNEIPYQVFSSTVFLQQCIRNIIDNGLKYAPLGSTVYVKVSADGAYISLQVEDEGSGIPKDEEKNIFKPFSNISTSPTAGESSTGLGLSTVKKLLQMLNGDITYQRSSYGGACFIIKIPMA